jgi:hypothetical protein
VERQCCANEFRVWLWKSGAKTLQFNHQAYGDNAMRRAAVFKWFKRFRDRSRGQNRLFHYPPEACGKRSAVRFRRVESCKKCVACQGRYFEKTEHLRRSQQTASRLWRHFPCYCRYFSSVTQNILEQMDCITGNPKETKYRGNKKISHIKIKNSLGIYRSSFTFRRG